MRGRQRSANVVRFGVAILDDDAMMPLAPS